MIETTEKISGAVSFSKGIKVNKALYDAIPKEQLRAFEERVKRCYEVYLGLKDKETSMGAKKQAYEGELVPFLKQIGIEFKKTKINKEEKKSKRAKATIEEAVKYPEEELKKMFDKFPQELLDDTKDDQKEYKIEETQEEDIFSSLADPFDSPSKEYSLEQQLDDLILDI